MKYITTREKVYITKLEDLRIGDFLETNLTRAQCTNLNKQFLLDIYECGFSIIEINDIILKLARLDGSITRNGAKYWTCDWGSLTGRYKVNVFRFIKTVELMPEPRLDLIE